MKVCGIEIKGSEAIFCIMSFEDGLIGITDCRTRKFTLHQDKDHEKMQAFQFTFKKLLEDYDVSEVVIRERPQKGKFAGGAVGFKMEAALQLLDGITTVFLNPTESKELIKKNPIAVDYKETGLKQFQEVAFQTVYAYLMKKKYVKED